jgi:hypothetical protein
VRRELGFTTREMTQHGGSESPLPATPSPNRVGEGRVEEPAEPHEHQQEESRDEHVEQAVTRLPDE